MRAFAAGIVRVLTAVSQTGIMFAGLRVDGLSPVCGPLWSFFSNEINVRR